MPATTHDSSRRSAPGASAAARHRPSSQVELYTLGRLVTRCPALPYSPRLGPRHLALLVYLVHESRPVYVSELVDLLGGPGDRDVERDALLRLVRWLHRSLPGLSVDVSHGSIRLEREIWWDVRQLDEAVDRRDLARVARLYKGDFLAGFSSGSEPFDRWAAEQRGRLREFWDGAVRGMAVAAEGSGSWENAALWWRVLVGRDRFDSEAVSRLMSAWARAGNSELAARTYEDYATSLRRRSVTPDPRVTRRARELEIPEPRAPSPAVTPAPKRSGSSSGQSRGGRPSRSPEAVGSTSRAPRHPHDRSADGRIEVVRNRDYDYLLDHPETPEVFTESRLIHAIMTGWARLTTPRAIAGYRQLLRELFERLQDLGELCLLMLAAGGRMAYALTVRGLKAASRVLRRCVPAARRAAAAARTLLGRMRGGADRAGLALARRARAGTRAGERALRGVSRRSASVLRTRRPRPRFLALAALALALGLALLIPWRSQSGGWGPGSTGWGSLSRLSLPDVAVPSISLPDVALPDITLPEFELPEFTAPKLALPELSLPDVPLPDVSVPKEEIHELSSRVPGLMATPVARLGAVLSGPLVEEGGAIVVADIQAESGTLLAADPALDRVIALALEAGLAQARRYRVLSRERVLRAVPTRAHDRFALSRQAAVGTGLGTVIGGRLRQLERAYALRLFVLEADGGERAAFELLLPDSAPLAPLDIGVRRLARRLGASGAELEAFRAPGRILSPSLSALGAYARGRSLLKAGRYAAAERAAGEAVARDPGFASAYRLAAEAQALAGRRAAARASLEAAWAYRNRLSVREALRVEAERHALARRYGEAIGAYERLFRTYRRDVAALKSLAVLQRMIGARGDGVGNLRLAHQIDPVDWPPLQRVAGYLGYRGPLWERVPPPASAP